jgi:hypothetical protein
VGLIRGDFPWESGAKTHREMAGRCAPSFLGILNSRGSDLSPTGHVMGSGLLQQDRRRNAESKKNSSCGGCVTV